jgi:uncharacterized protein with PQ loop repeat
MIQVLGLMAAVILPLWNVPLIIKIIRRKSSADISQAWAYGVWICLLMMLPSGMTSKELVWRVFNLINFIFFSGVTLVVWFYRKNPKNARG